MQRQPQGSSPTKSFRVLPVIEYVTLWRPLTWPVGLTPMGNKLSEQLTQNLDEKDPSGLLDVVIELHGGVEAGKNATQSRADRIAALKESFNRSAAPVEEAVRKVGGEVTGHAWINQTLRARVPADKVKQLSEHDRVAKLDIPHPIERDTSK